MDHLFSSYSKLEYIFKKFLKISVQFTETHHHCFYQEAKWFVIAIKYEILVQIMGYFFPFSSFKRKYILNWIENSGLYCYKSLGFTE